MIRCKSCAMPNTRPDTHWEDGECSACRNYQRRPAIDWDQRERDLIQLLDRHDGRCIVPSSGGKDSTYQVLTLVGMGADVTIVTARTCHLTDVGRANIDNLARFARTVEIVPCTDTRAKLNRLGLELVGDISWPEHVLIHRTPFKAALDLKIPLIFYGENPCDQYGSPPGAEEAKQMTQRWASEYGGFLGLRPQDLIGMDGITRRDMADYLAPDDAVLELVGVEAHFLGQYVPWDSRRNADVAVAAGMQTLYTPPSKANYWVEENLDNAQTGLHDWLAYLKYGYSRGTAQVSVDCRAGRIGRDAAIAIAKTCEGQFPTVYAGVPVEETLSRIGMTLDEFHQIAARFAAC